MGLHTTLILVLVLIYAAYASVAAAPVTESLNASSQLSSILVDCSSLSSLGCASCVSGAPGQCEWCGNTQSCQAISASCSYCPRTSAATCPGPTAPFCANMTDCLSCTRNNCGWCGNDKKCYEPEPAPAHDKCTSGGCSYCFRAPTESALCPAVPSCSSLTDCASCTANNCGWCGNDQVCYEADIGSKNKCTSGSCSYCWRAPSDSGSCPKVA